MLSKEFDFMGAEIPTMPENIPALKLREAQEIIKKETGEDYTQEPDLEPQNERWLCEYAKKEYGSDFIFITHFPMSKRPMYTYEDEIDQGYSKGFDLFSWCKVTTAVNEFIYDNCGGHQSQVLIRKNSLTISSLQVWYATTWGFGNGLERLTAKLLGLENVKEATLFPRDLNRIDSLLSK